MPGKELNPKEVAAALNEVALLLELKGENPFRVRAYANAARSMETLENDLRTLVEGGRLKELPGIGEGMARQITELATVGKLDLLEELRRTIPPGHREILQIPGLGPKKIKALYDALQITTVGELEYACLENRLVTLQGFGHKTQEKILKGIEQLKRYQGRYRYGEVIPAAEAILSMTLSYPKVLRASLAGSVRRKMETVGNINVVLGTSNPAEVRKGLTEMPEAEAVGLRIHSSGRLILRGGIEIDLQATSDTLFPHSLFHLTGSLAHWNAMVARARAVGFDLDENGLRRGDRLIPCKEEEEIFRALGLDFIPPELRENEGEIEAAEIHQIPRLVEGRDLRGTFHVHSSYSDGTNSIRRVAETGKKMGLSYIGLSDHSQSARYAGGLSPATLRKQWEEVDRVNETLGGLYIFKGTESDILADGSLDYEETLLREFDFVIASVHSHFNMTSQEMTRRVVAALRNPHTTILGHPTGRLLLAREPYAINMESVIDEAAREGVAIELNAHPFRLDLDWRLCRYAKERGVKVAINPDSHEEAGLEDLRFGIGIARKGWLEAADVLNTMNLEEMKAFLKRRKPWTRHRTRKG